MSHHLIVTQPASSAPSGGQDHGAPAVNVHLRPSASSSSTDVEVHDPSHTLRPSQVLVRFLAAPINPLDLLVMGGKYPVRPRHSLDDDSGEAILGYDGVGEVLAAGPSDPAKPAIGLSPGDLVVPAVFGVGTWRSHPAMLDATELQRADPRLLSQGDSDSDGVIFASLMRLAVAPAYFLVEDVRPLKPGDAIILNAGTSVVGQFVAQFARLRGVRTIHVVRDRESPADVEVIREALRQLGRHSTLDHSRGATGQSGGSVTVITESELSSAQSAAELKNSHRIVLAIDAVFGSSGSALLQTLSDGGSYVQLGFLGSSQQRLSLNPADLFGRRLTMEGFRGSARLAARSRTEQTALFDWFADLFVRGELVLPPLGLGRIDCGVFSGCDAGVVARQRVLDAVKRAQEGGLGQRKQVLMFRN